MANIAAIQELIEPIVREQGFDLVRVKMINTEVGPTLQVMAEDPATGQMLIDQCTTLSRAISEMLDEEDPIEEEYSLEVSSPGIDRPLTRAKDYALWAGHKVKIGLSEPMDGRKKFQGTLLGLETADGGEAVRVKLEDGSGEDVLLPMNRIDSAKLVLTDELLAATQPQQMN